MSWVNVLSSCGALTPNQFLKHLCVLCDVGGEKLSRFANDIRLIFPKGYFVFNWKGKKYKHILSKADTVWSNPALGIDKKGLAIEKKLEGAIVDVVMLLLWGSSIVDNPNVPQEILDKCVVGNFIGKPDELDKYVQQRYIAVSKIISGSAANDSGHICEEDCRKRLAQYLKQLSDKFEITGHNVEGVSQNGKTETTFDIVVMNKVSKCCCAIEVSFQVTTNSVIERKASLAKDRKSLLNKKGHKVAYVIDGAGNFERRSAVSTILAYSDCSVNFSDDGIAELAKFISSNC